MAGDWIKMRGNLWDDPRVSKLCDITEQNESAIIGGLYWLWSSADQHSEDGIMPGLTVRSIDRKTCIPRFGEALIAVGWLADHPEGVRIVRFEEHNGKSAKRRCSESVRKMSARHADKEQINEGRIEDEEQQECAPRVRVREESKPTTLSESSVDGAPEQEEENPPAAENTTRKGDLCKQLRVIGIQAAPHFSTWPELLDGFTDSEIITAAEDAVKAKPGERIHMNYLLPKLRDRAIPSARASPRSTTGRQARVDNYTAEAAQARGNDENKYGNGRVERDITGEAVRVA